MADRSRFSPLLMLLVLLVIGVLVGRAVLQYAGRGVDFQWDGTYLLLHGQNPYTATLAQQIIEARLLPVSALYFPSALALLIPYALFPYSVARWLWLLSNLGFTVGTIALLFPLFAGRRGGWREGVMFTLVVVGSAPWAIGIGIGQHAIFALFFLLLAMELARQGRQGWAGIALAIAAFKYVLVLPIALYFLYKRWYRPLWIVLGVHLGLHLWAAYRLGVSPIELFVAPLRLSALTHTLGGYLDLIALQRYAGYLFPALSGGVEWWGIGSTAILGLLLVATVWKRNPNESLYLTTLCWVGMIALYHPHYDLVVLVIPLFLLLYRKADFDPATRTLGLAGIGAVYFLNRITTGFITILPADIAAVVARVVLFTLYAIYYGVAIRLVVVLFRHTKSFGGSRSLLSSSQGGA